MRFNFFLNDRSEKFTAPHQKLQLKVRFGFEKTLNLKFVQTFYKI